MRSIVSWHPVLTEHQSHTLQALANATGAPVTVVVARSEDPLRKAQGWTAAPDASGLVVRLLEGGGGLAHIRSLLREHRDSVHLFGSPFDHPRFMAALGIALRRRLAVHLISEPYSPIAAGYLQDRQRLLTWFKSKLRPAVYRLYGALLRGRVRGVFAISPLAAAQYESIGIARAKIHPFGYFVPAIGAEAFWRPDAQAPTGARALFVGNLVARKGLAELSAAGRRLHAQGVDLHVDVYGTGDPAPFDFDGTAIRHVGSIPFGQAQSVIAGYDFLVLPSRYDGWGVVVNESVLAGVPVVCSDRVGAGAFVRRWGCGLVYALEEPGALDGALRTMAGNAALREQMRQACRAARHWLEPAVGGGYLADVIEACARGERAPANPWYDV